jgi:RNA polymerase sigma factor (sigma-70 family)
MKTGWKERFIASVASLHGRQLVKFFALRLRDVAEAQDLAQEVYLRLLRMDRPDLIRSPEAYLFTIAANIAREHALKRATHPLQVALEDTPNEELEAQGDLEGDSFVRTAPESAMNQVERMRELERALQQLSPKARAALLWHRRDGKTYEEIGARLGVSRNMVKKYLVQAVAHCRKYRDAGREE